MYELQALHIRQRNSSGANATLALSLQEYTKPLPDENRASERQIARARVNP